MAAVSCGAVTAPTGRAEAAQQQDWFAHAYAARFTHKPFLDTLRLQADMDDSWLKAAGVGHRFADPAPHLQLEWELQAAQHSGLQHHTEFNALGIVRIHRFAWDTTLRNSVAFGLGVSYAAAEPILEKTYGNTERTLVYMLFEVTAATPHTPDWNLFLRIHHRSGAFGLVADDVDGSNFIGLGLRHHFAW
ncbi:MAG: hypothetical protein AB1450_05880 [Pseudomonadota bacterium]